MNQEIETVEISTDPENHADEIAAVAYSYWETRGRIDGHDVEDWLMAEHEVLRRHGLAGSNETEQEETHRSAISHAA